MTTNEKVNVVALVQARMGSTRFPGKVLQLIDTHPVLWHVVNRIKAASRINEVVVTTSVRPENDAIRDFCLQQKIACFSGDEADVLDRFYQAAVFHRASHLVRVTGDCPLVDPGLIDQIAGICLSEELDYCAVGTGAGVADKTNFKRFPDGMDAEMISLPTLKRIWSEATVSTHREHVTPYLFLNQHLFKMRYLECEKDYSNLRLTLDYPEDLKLISSIFKKLGASNASFSIAEILRLFETEPELAQLNIHHQLTQGYGEFWKK